MCVQHCFLSWICFHHLLNEILYTTVLKCRLHVFLHFGIFESASYQSLRGVKCVFRVCNGLTSCRHSLKSQKLAYKIAHDIIYMYNLYPVRIWCLSIFHEVKRGAWFIIGKQKIFLKIFKYIPTSLSPSFENATTDGVVRDPSEFSNTFGVFPSITATQELVVPKSIPITCPWTLSDLQMKTE